MSSRMTVETPGARKRRILSQFVKVLCASLGMCMMGTLFTYPSELFSDLTHHNTSLYDTYIDLDGKEDMVGSLLMLSSLPGAWVSAVLAVGLGRRKTMILNAVAGVLGWLGVALIPSIVGILFSRCVSGLALGGLSVTVNAYVAELADPDIRGMMCMSLNLAIMIGQLFTVFVGYWARYYTVAFVNALLPTAFFISLLWLPESPSLLVLKGQDEEAKEILYKLRGKHADIQGEITSYKALNYEARKGPAWRGLLKPKVIKSLLVVSGLFFICTYTGYLVINMNAARLFEDAGTTVDGDFAAIVLMLVQLAGGLGGFFLMDKIGRRNIMFTGLILVTVALASMAVYIGLLPDVGTSVIETTTVDVLGTREPEPVTEEVDISGGDDRIGGWIPLACLAVSQTGMALGVNNIPFILSQEYFPTAIRSQANSICFTVYTLATFSVLQFYTPMVEGLTQMGLFAFYATVSFIGIPYTAFFVRETMGKQVG